MLNSIPTFQMPHFLYTAALLSNSFHSIVLPLPCLSHSFPAQLSGSTNTMTALSLSLAHCSTKVAAALQSG